MKNKKVLIIAEAGVNHNGNLNIAKKMVTVAKNCGADYIKFQSFTAKKLATKSVNQAPYQKAIQLNDSKSRHPQDRQQRI